MNRHGSSVDGEGGVVGDAGSGGDTGSGGNTGSGSSAGADTDSGMAACSLAQSREAGRMVEKETTAPARERRQAPARAWLLARVLAQSREVERVMMAARLAAECLAAA